MNTLPTDAVAAPHPHRTNRLLAALWIVAIGTRLLLLGSDGTNNVLQHDIVGHMEYVLHLLSYGGLPNLTACWQCYQPPLYYLVAAPVGIFALAFKLDLYITLRLFSLVLFAVFAWFGIRTVQLYLRDERARLFAAALILFWPSGIVHSLRIGNDALYYALFAAAFYFIARWHLRGEHGDIVLAIGLTALGLLTKLNAVILVGILFWIIVSAWIAGRNKRELIDIANYGIFLILLVSAFVISRPWNMMMNDGFERSAGQLFVANKSLLNPALSVGNEPANYLLVDMRAMLRTPFADPLHDNAGRQSLPTHLFKTALFGEFNYGSHPVLVAAAYTVAGIGSFLLVALIVAALTIRYSPIRAFRPSNLYLPLAMSFVLSLAASIAMRVEIPYSCAGDFRYIFPIIIPLSILCFEAFLRTPLAGGKLRIAGYSLVILFVVSSAAFFTYYAIGHAQGAFRAALWTY